MIQPSILPDVFLCREPNGSGESSCQTVPMTVPFATSARSSVGLEWELMLADTATGDLIPRGPELLAALEERSTLERYTVTGELLTNTVELTSGIGDTVAAAVDDIADAIAEVRTYTTRTASICCAPAAIRSRSGTTRASPTRPGTTSSSSAPSGGVAT